MGSDFSSAPIHKFDQVWQISIARALAFPFGRLILLLLLGLISISVARATGNAIAGKEAWVKTCEHCHGRPQPKSTDAFSDYDTTANRLSVYASDPAAITKTATEGYIVPEGNTNDKVPVGHSSKEEMGTFAGMAPNKLGYGTTPTQYAIDISAYFASLFDAPGAPAISSVTTGNAQANVSFTAAKSDLTITGYTVTSSPGGFKGIGTSSPITVSGLTNGTAYTFMVAATSNAGTGKPSLPSISVTPNAAQVAQATVAATVSSTKINNVATVKPSLPGIPATAMTPVAPKIPNAIQSIRTNTTSVAKTSNVTAVKVSPPTNTITPVYDPNAPMIVRTRAGSGQARVFFTVPAGSAATVTTFTVNALSRGVSTGITATGTKSPITVTGLTNGSDYTFTVTANSSTGKSLLSTPSDTVTPLRILGD